MASARISSSQLYDHDYYAWIQDQVRTLRERRIEDVDWENVAEEIEDLGKSERRSVQSHLENLIEHLLKLSYTRGTTRARNARLWEGTGELARLRIRHLLDESLSLRPTIGELFPHAYKAARITTRVALKLPRNAIPETPPWTLEQVMDDSFVPMPDA